MDISASFFSFAVQPKLESLFVVFHWPTSRLRIDTELMTYELNDALTSSPEIRKLRPVIWKRRYVVNVLHLTKYLGLWLHPDPSVADVV